MIRVLIAEDSATVRELLSAILESDPEISVIGVARNGEEAIEMAIRLRPDLITMDIHMPRIDGLEATREIMRQAPAPILIVSSRVSDEDVALSLNATRMGALMAIRTPAGPNAPDYEKLRDHLLAMVKAMADVKVVRRRYASSSARVGSLPRVAPGRPNPGPVELIAIAGSTGAPAALQRILADLPAKLPVPVLIVQHMSPGFVHGLCSWLGRGCKLPVKIAEDREPFRPGVAYLAPDDRHLGARANGSVLLSDADRILGFRPSANFLYNSVAESYGGAVVAVILSGMGQDGVQGLRAVDAAGGAVIAQDEATSVVFGMPGEAVRAGLVDLQLPVGEIAERLIQLTREQDVAENS